MEQDPEERLEVIRNRSNFNESQIIPFALRLRYIRKLFHLTRRRMDPPFTEGPLFRARFYHGASLTQKPDRIEERTKEVAMDFPRI